MVGIQVINSIQIRKPFSDDQNWDLAALKGTYIQSMHVSVVLYACVHDTFT